MDIQKKVLGPEHPDTFSTMGNLASTYCNQGRWNKAEQLGLQVMDIQKKLLGPEHLSTLITMGNLASTYSGSKNCSSVCMFLRNYFSIR
jgi:Tetratricopeptide repeat